ncbi:uncharacterized protein [Argopecten irradians]|uniref:uncharacterized protein isoform X1 n=1 Tax=Argopecten irradians TaxID=31199 RepID=UPI00371CC368
MAQLLNLMVFFICFRCGSVTDMRLEQCKLTDNDEINGRHIACRNGKTLEYWKPICACNGILRGTYLQCQPNPYEFCCKDEKIRCLSGSEELKDYSDCLIKYNQPKFMCITSDLEIRTVPVDTRTELETRTVPFVDNGTANGQANLNGGSLRHLCGLIICGIVKIINDHLF